MAEVMIIDDNQAVLEVLGNLLRHQGYTVSTAADGAEALAYLRKNGAPSLILLDLMMPVMNGWQFRAEQLKDPVLRSVPTVILSSIFNIESEARVLQADGYIPKTFAFEEILGMVRNYC
ncbi:MAG: response regulator [Terriglobia bacterium]